MQGNIGIEVGQIQRKIAVSEFNGAAVVRFIRFTAAGEELEYTDLIDMELVFGRGKDGVVLTGELSPDTMRLWDSRTHEKLDKDRFRKGLGNVGDAYREMFGRLNIGRV